MAELSLTIQTPSKTVYEGRADSVHLKTEDGEMEVFPGHAPLSGTIAFSHVIVHDGSHEENFLLRQGFVFIDPKDDRVRLLAYAADKTSELDHKSAKEYMDAVLEALEKKEDLSDFQVQFLEDQKLIVGKMMEELEK